MIVALNLGTTEADNSIQKFLAQVYFDMIHENIIEAKYSTLEIVKLLEKGHVSQTITEDNCDEKDDGLVDKNNI